MGLRVPDVMTTLWNFWKTGFIAKLASRQLNCTTHRAFSLRQVLGPQPPGCIFEESIEGDTA